MFLHHQLQLVSEFTLPTVLVRLLFETPNFTKLRQTSLCCLAKRSVLSVLVGHFCFFYLEYGDRLSSTRSCLSRFVLLHDTSVRKAFGLPQSLHVCPCAGHCDCSWFFLPTLYQHNSHCYSCDGVVAELQMFPCS